jgi:hypothetical protein
MQALFCKLFFKGFMQDFKRDNLPTCNRIANSSYLNNCPSNSASKMVDFVKFVSKALITGYLLTRKGKVKGSTFLSFCVILDPDSTFMCLYYTL